MPKRTHQKPIKLYTPKGAVRALLTGKVLKNRQGNIVYWNISRSAFTEETKNGNTMFCTDFSVLYERQEAANV